MFEGDSLLCFPVSESALCELRDCKRMMFKKKKIPPRACRDLLPTHREERCLASLHSGAPFVFSRVERVVN